MKYRQISLFIISIFISLSLVVPIHATSQQENNLPTLSLDIKSNYGYVIDIEHNQVLLDKNSNSRMFPASMTKMMTVLVAIEEIADTEQKVLITKQMVEGLIEQDASVAGYVVGETPTVLDLMYAAALPSGADACNALALTVSGSFESFISKMNEKAKILHMDNTHFTNSTGLHDDNHYSTAQDICTLLSYCIQNDLFCEVFSASTYTTTPTLGYPDGFPLVSTAQKVKEKLGFSLPESYIGGKTGYTDEAGHCLASWAQVNDMTIITVLAGAMGDYYSIDSFKDTSNILDTLQDWNYINYVNTEDVLKEITVHHEYEDITIPVKATQSLQADLPLNQHIKYKVDIIDEIDSQVEDSVAEAMITVFVDENEIYTEKQEILIPREPNLFGRLLKRLRILGKQMKDFLSNLFNFVKINA